MPKINSPTSKTSRIANKPNEKRFKSVSVKRLTKLKNPNHPKNIKKSPKLKNSKKSKILQNSQKFKIFKSPKKSIKRSKKVKILRDLEEKRKSKMDKFLKNNNKVFCKYSVSDL